MYVAYHSDPRSQFQPQDTSPDLADWHNDYLWVQHLPAHTSCKLNAGHYCKHDYCPQHGQYQRIEKANRILALGEPAGDAYAVTLHFGASLTPEPVSQARRHLLKKLTRYTDLAYVWRLHWRHRIPHLHMTILLGYTNRSKLTSLIKQVWTESLTRIGHTEPDRERVYCKPVESYKLWVDYIFQANKLLTEKDCPPKMPDNKHQWRFGGISSKAYKHYCQMADRVFLRSSCRRPACGTKATAS